MATASKTSWSPAPEVADLAAGTQRLRSRAAAVAAIAVAALAAACSDTTTSPQGSGAGSDAPATAAGGAGPELDALVARVVDGDTLELADGATVRLIGIDTTEAGEPCHDEATAHLRVLVESRTVVLNGGARDDRDRYGRLLRYVEVDGTDVNLEMIRSGWARARYDSRDGYGRHPREGLYVAASAATPHRCAIPEVPAPQTPQEPEGGDGTGADPRFASCAEAKRHGYGPYQAGRPEYGWYRDGDSDGTVCE